MKAACPPFLHPGDRVVLFDGVCKLCSGSVRFLIAHDPHRKIKLASMQSTEGQALLHWFNLPTEQFQSMAFIEDNAVFERSDAFIRIMRHLPWPWRAFSAILVVPRPVRDWCYDRIALNRYRLFGRHNMCLLPDPAHKGRFLDNRD